MNIDNIKLELNIYDINLIINTLHTRINKLIQLKIDDQIPDQYIKDEMKRCENIIEQLHAAIEENQTTEK